MNCHFSDPPRYAPFEGVRLLFNEATMSIRVSGSLFACFKPDYAGGGTFRYHHPHNRSDAGQIALVYDVPQRCSSKGEKGASIWDCLGAQRPQRNRRLIELFEGRQSSLLNSIPLVGPVDVIELWFDSNQSGIFSGFRRGVDGSIETIQGGFELNRSEDQNQRSHEM